MNRSAGRLIISDHKDFISIHLTHFTTIDCMLLLSCESVNYYTKKNRERIEMGNCCHFHPYPYYIDSDLREIRHHRNSFPIGSLVKIGTEGKQFYFTTADDTGTHYFPMGSQKKAQNYLKKVVRLSQTYDVQVSEVLNPDYTLLGFRAKNTKEESTKEADNKEPRKKVKFNLVKVL